MSALAIDAITHRYGDRLALDAVSFEVGEREIFGLLGPNGGGKTTLFRILSTLIRPGSGTARLFGTDIVTDANAARLALGVVFQAPSLDKKLTVAENLRHQGHLYGLRGADLSERIARCLTRLRVSDRSGDLVETLSGGLQRRVEIAKALLHDPRFLLFDEPSAGLDPGARIDLWAALERLRAEQGTTVLLTTHLMEEADHCDRIGILDRGRLVAEGVPAALRAELGAEILTIRTSDASATAADLKARFNVNPVVLDGCVRIQHPQPQRLLGEILDAFAGRFDSVSIARPTLEDVFIRKTGHGLHDA
jgi:ABC-2 type transport system ATP-binding protein